MAIPGDHSPGSKVKGPAPRYGAVALTPLDDSSDRGIDSQVRAVIDETRRSDVDSAPQRSIEFKDTDVVTGALAPQPAVVGAADPIDAGAGARRRGAALVRE